MLDTNKNRDFQFNFDFHIFDNLKDEVIVYEIKRDIGNIIVDLRVKYMNNAAITNKSIPEDVSGKSITELYDNDVTALHLKMANEILESGEGKKYKAYIKSSNEYYSISAYSPNDNVYITIGTDITEYIKAKDELRQVSGDLEEKVRERTTKLEESNESLKNEIGQRRNVEKLLFKSEQKFRKVFEHARNGITLCDEQGVVIEWNRAQEKIIGKKREKVIGKFIWDVLFESAIEERKTPEVYENMKVNVSKMFETGKIPWDRIREVEIQRLDGERRFIEEMVFTIPTDNGFMACGIIQDITERKRMEETLRKSEQKFRSVIEQSHNGFTLCNEQGLIIEWNKAQEMITGITRKKVIGTYLWDMIYHSSIRKLENPEAYENLKTAILEVFQTGELPWDNSVREMEIQRPDGKHCFIEDRAFTIPTDRGFMACNVTQDITERKQMEESLKESEEKFREIFNNANDMISLAESNDGSPSKYLEVNKVGCERLGYTKDEFLKLTPSDIIAPEAWAEMGENSSQIAKNGRAKFEIVHITKKEERIPVEVNIHSFKLREKEVKLAISRDISERKKMEETLHKNEYKFRSIIEQSYNGIMLCDEQGRIVEWNKAQEEIIGIRREETIGKFLWDIFYHSAIEECETPEAYENKKKAISKVFQTGKLPWNNPVREMETKMPDGKLRFIEDRIFTIPTNKGFMACNITQDVTDRKKVEESLRESEYKFRSVIEQSYNGVALCDEQGRIVEWNKAQEKISGIKREEVIGKFLWDVLFNLVIEERKIPKVYENLKRSLLKVFQSGKMPTGAHSQELEIQRPDGKRSFVEQLVFTIQTDNGFMACAIIQDITERKKMENALKESEEKFRETLQQSHDGIALANEQGTIIEWNPALEQITGWKKEDMIGKSLGDMVYQLSPEEKQTPELKKRAKLMQIHLLEGKNIINGRRIVDKEIQRPDGNRRFVQSIDFPIKTKKGTILGSFNRDITEQKKAETQLKETVEELKRSNEELQRFAYVASHDLQEPLRTIASFTQLIEKRYKGKLDSDADEFMDYIVEAAVRMKELIGALLDYSRITTKVVEFKSVDCGSILDQTINNLQYAIKESKAKITCDSMPVVTGNEVQIQRVFQNLISNAIKFKKEEEPLEIHISAINDENNNEYVFSVQDNGIGIEKEYFDRIFTIFQRLHTRDEYSGTGIGLSVVKRIIERHGGRIWLESEPSVGSVFYFTIPY